MIVNLTYQQVDKLKIFLKSSRFCGRDVPMYLEIEKALKEPLPKENEQVKPSHSPIRQPG